VSAQEVFLIRHGETEWSLNGRHTGRTDIALTEHGREVARRWRPYASGKKFALVLSNPLQRARQTCELARLGAIFCWRPSTLCVLSSYHCVPAVKRWNAPLLANRRRVMGGSERIATRNEGIVIPEGLR